MPQRQLPAWDLPPTNQTIVGKGCNTAAMADFPGSAPNCQTCRHLLASMRCFHSIGAVPPSYFHTVSPKYCSAAVPRTSRSTSGASVTSNPLQIHTLSVCSVFPDMGMCYALVQTPVHLRRPDICMQKRVAICEGEV